MWTYSQSTGLLSHDSGYSATCYSGHGTGLNNPAMDAVHSVGPIPRGRWRFGIFFDHPHLGPMVSALTPVGHDAHGRTEFFMHGAHTNDHHDSSDGCIIAGPDVRTRVKKSYDTDLTVTE